MLKPFVRPVLLVPFGLPPPPLGPPAPVYDRARIHTHPTNTREHTFVCKRAHTPADPGQLLRQVARAAKPLQQLSSLGSCLHDNSRHDAPADERLPCFHLWENNATPNTLGKKKREGKKNFWSAQLNLVSRL